MPVVGVNLALEEKVIALENLVHQLSRQLQSGSVTVQQAVQPQASVTRTRAKSPSGFKPPTGRIQEVLKTATKQDIQQIKNVWAQSLSQLQKSQSALLAEAEPVAASAHAFVLKFKYDIHCQMVAENNMLLSSFVQILATQIGSVYEVLCIPEDDWLKLREEFIRERSLYQQQELDVSEQPSVHEEPVAPFIDDAQPISSEDPLIVEAEKLFGKDFVEVVEE